MSKKKYWDFYDSICISTLDNKKVSSAPWFVRTAIIEVQDALRSLRKGNSDGFPPQPPKKENGGDRVVDSMVFERIIDNLLIRKLEQDEFLKVFPDWKEDRLKIIDDLEEIVAKRHESQSKCEKANLVARAGGIVGVVGMAARAAQVVMPIWMSLLVNAASASNGLIRVFTAVEKVRSNYKLSEVAKALVAKDMEQFSKINRWFKYNSELLDAAESIISSDTMQKWCKMFDDFYINASKLNGESLISTTNKLLIDFADVLIRAGFTPNHAYAVAGAFLLIFLIHFASGYYVNGISAGHVILLKDDDTTFTYAILPVREFMNPYSGFYARNAERPFVRIAIDFVPAVLNLKGSEKEKEQIKKLKKGVDKLKHEMESIQKVYDQLKTEVELDEKKNSSRGFVNDVFIPYFKIIGCLVMLSYVFIVF